jgi:hypothetical protein
MYATHFYLFDDSMSRYARPTHQLFGCSFALVFVLAVSQPSHRCAPLRPREPISSEETKMGFVS